MKHADNRDARFGRGYTPWSRWDWPHAATFQPTRTLPPSWRTVRRQAGDQGLPGLCAFGVAARKGGRRDTRQWGGGLQCVSAGVRGGPRDLPEKHGQGGALVPVSVSPRGSGFAGRCARPFTRSLRAAASVAPLGLPPQSRRTAPVLNPAAFPGHRRSSRKPPAPPAVVRRKGKTGGMRKGWRAGPGQLRRAAGPDGKEMGG